MTQEELLAALSPIRLPASMMLLDWREMLAMAGLGLLLAALIALVLSPVLARRVSDRARIKATRGLPAGERLLAVARINGGLPPKLRKAGYLPAPAISDDQIERAVRNRRTRE